MIEKIKEKIFLYKSHLFAVAVFLVISGVYFSPVFDGYKFGAQDINQWYGMSKEIVDHRDNTSEESLWTKRMFSGMPAYQISTKSPSNLVQYVSDLIQLNLPRPMNLLFLYLVGFYILLVSMKIDFRLAIVGSICYAFSTYFLIIIQAGHMTKAHAIGYIPLIVAFVLHTYQKDKFIFSSILMCLFLALQLHANHYQITYYTLIILLIIGLVEFFKNLKNKNLVLFVKKSIILILAGLLALGVNYTRITTTMEYAPETQRSKSELKEKDDEVSDGLDYSYITDYSYGISETMTFLIPNFMGGAWEEDIDENSDLYQTFNSGFKAKYGRNIPGSMIYWGDKGAGAPTYVGAIVFFLFILGIFYLEKSTLKYWIIISVILSIMLGWGRNFSFLTEFFINYIPGYNKFRAITMVMVIAEFGIALLAVLTLNKLLFSNIEKLKLKKFWVTYIILGGITLLLFIAPTLAGDFLPPGQKISGNDFVKELVEYRKSILSNDSLRSFFFISLAVIVLWMFVKNKLSNIYAVIILGVLILCDMWMVNKRYLNDESFSKPLAIYDRNNSGELERGELRKKKNDEEAIGRVINPPFMLLPNRADIKIIETNKKDKVNYRVYDLGNTFNSSRSSYFHNSIGGYHAAKLKRYQDLIDKYLSRSITIKDESGEDKSITNPDFSSEVLSMLNCGWFINGSNAIKSSEFKLNPVINKGDVIPLGNAWFINKIHFVDNAIEEFDALSAIKEGNKLVNFNPEKVVIINNKDREILNSRNSYKKESSEKIKLLESSYKPNHLTYSLTEISSDQFAVFSEIYYEHGWNAYIDGKLTPHFQVNYVLRGLEVPKGSKKIEFKFEPDVYNIGENVSLISSILLLSLLGFFGFKEIKEYNGSIKENKS